MQGNRSRDTGPEIRLRSALHRAGLRFRKNKRPVRSLRCQADIVFPRYKLAVFVDGCFWHGCVQHARRPSEGARNREYWLAKLDRNVARDRRNDEQLLAAGWRVLHIWEHEELAEALEKVRATLATADAELRS